MVGGRNELRRRTITSVFLQNQAPSVFQAGLFLLCNFFYSCDVSVHTGALYTFPESVNN